MPSQNLSSLLEVNGARLGNAAALRSKRHGLVRTVGWRELALRVAHAAAGLEMRGFDEGSLLLTLGPLAPEWLVVVLAVHRLGGTVLPVAAESPDDVLATSLSLVRPRFLLTHGDDELRRVLTLRALLAPDVHLIHVHAAARAADFDLVSLERLGQLGEQSAQPSPPVHVPLAPAFVRFARDAQGTVRREAACHGTLIASTRLPAWSFTAQDELCFDGFFGCGEAHWLGLSAWLVSGAALGLATGAAQPVRAHAATR